jgi:hypothetical protein
MPLSRRQFVQYAELLSAGVMAGCVPFPVSFNKNLTDTNYLSSLTQEITVSDIDPMQLWQEYCGKLALSGERHLGRLESDAAKMDLMHSLTMSLNPMYVAAMSDADYPEFVPVCNNAIPIASANPDFNYTYTAVDCEGVYHITGRRGTTRFLGIQCCSDYSIFTDKPGPTYCEYMLDDLSLKEGGEFDVILSKIKPSDWQGDWWEMPGQTEYLFARDCSCDWLNERAPDMAITRIDVPPSRKRRSAEDIQQRLERLYNGHVLSNGLWLTIIEAQRKAGAVNSIRFIDFVQWGGVPDQVYYEGNFDVGPDEALIIETELPKNALYWAVQLTDEVYMCIDAQHRQGALNDKQAVVDSDGKLRYVLSWEDPDIHNWLDIQGYQKGSICGRWNKADSAPLPVAKKVKFSELSQYLPNDIAKVTQKQRHQQLMDRRVGYQMRRRW